MPPNPPRPPGIPPGMPCHLRRARQRSVRILDDDRDIFRNFTRRHQPAGIELARNHFYLHDRSRGRRRRRRRRRRRSRQHAGQLRLRQHVRINQRNQDQDAGEHKLQPEREHHGPAFMSLPLAVHEGLIKHCHRIRSFPRRCLPLTLIPALPCDSLLSAAELLLPAAPGPSILSNRGSSARIPGLDSQ